MKKFIQYYKDYGTKIKPTRVQCILRMIAGGYLIYIGYTSIKELKNVGNKWPIFLILTIIFIVFGGWYLFINARVYFKNQYSDAARNHDYDDYAEDSTENAENVESIESSGGTDNEENDSNDNNNEDNETEEEK